MTKTTRPQQIAKAEQEPFFGSSFDRDPRYAETDEQRRTLHPDRVANSIGELVKNSSFAEGLEALRQLHEQKEGLMRRAKLAYPADVLEGATNARKGKNNWSGLLEHLGYEPKDDEAIGVLVPQVDSPYSTEVAFVSPVLRDDKWTVPYASIDRSPTLSEGRIPRKRDRRLSKTILRSGFMADSFQDSVPAEFDSKQEAMAALMGELEANSYALVDEGFRPIPPEATLGNIALGSVGGSQQT